MAAKRRPPTESEQNCKAGFDAFIRACMPALPSWRCGEDPPDYYVQLGGKEFAVEVSIILQKVMLGSARLRQRDVRDCIAKLVKGVESAAKETGVLKGKYIVLIPRPIPDWKQTAPLLKQLMLAFIAATGDNRAGSRKEFYKVAGRRCLIEKICDQGQAVGGGGPTDSRRAGEAERELEQLVAERIAAKVDALRLIAPPKVLLLKEQYPFAEASMYRSLVRPISGAEQFHTIYVHRRGQDDILLASHFPGLKAVWRR